MKTQIDVVSHEPPPVSDLWEAGELQGLAQTQTYPKGVELFQQGSLLDEVMRIKGGVTKLVRVDREGREMILALAFAGAWLGTAGVLARTPHPVTVVTCMRTVVMRMPANLFRDLLQRNVPLSLEIHQAHARELCRQTEWVGQLSSVGSRQRLQRVIRQLVAALGFQRSEAGIKLQLPVRHWELAQLVAITPEHLSRLFKIMESEGVIRRDKGWLVIPNVQRLCPECTGTCSGIPRCETALAGVHKLDLYQDCS